MDHVLELQEFFVEGKDHKRSHVLLHIAEPVSKKEKERGFFFVVAEINNGYEEQIEALQHIIDDVETEYYDEQVESPRTLEEILQDINRRAHHVLKYDDTEVSCVLGVVKDTSISLAYHGKPHAILFYTSKGNLAFTEIINKPGESVQLFSELVEGNLNPGDYMIISTPYLTQFFSEDRMSKLLSTRRIAESASHIQKMLQDLRNDFSFGGLIIHVTNQYDKPKTGKMPQQEQGSAESLNQLMASTKSTEDTLSPPLLAPVLSNLKERLAKRKERNAEEAKNPEPSHARTHKQYSVETNYRRKNRETGTESTFDAFLIALGHGLVFVGTGLILVLRKITGFLGYVFTTGVALSTNKNNSRARTIQSWKNTIRNQKNFFKHLPLTSKIILLLTIVLAGSFIGSIGYLRVKEARQVEEQTYQDTVQGITDKKDAAEAALVYNENARAFTLLQEAQALLNQLPEDSRSQKEKKDELRAQLETFLKQLRNITTVAPETFAKLTLPEGQRVSKMLRTEKDIVLFNEENNDVYFVNTVTKAQEKQTLDTIKHLFIAAFNNDDKAGYFIRKDGTLASYTVETRALTPKDIAYEKEQSSIRAMTIYNGKLYTLDTKNNQVYKHNKTLTGFDRGASWIVGNSMDLSAGTTIAIDGNIYIGTASGKIFKLFRGEQQAFTTNGLDPAFGSIEKIWTSDESTSLYILDSTNKRVVVLDKEGNFKKQFAADMWQKPTDMFVDEAASLIYILDNNTLYTFSTK